MKNWACEWLSISHVPFFFNKLLENNRITHFRLMSRKLCWFALTATNFNNRKDGRCKTINDLLWDFINSLLTIVFTTVWLGLGRFSKRVVLILMKELLSWLIESHHQLANQWHVVCLRHIFRLSLEQVLN